MAFTKPPNQASTATLLWHKIAAMNGKPYSVKVGETNLANYTQARTSAARWARRNGYTSHIERVSNREFRLYFLHNDSVKMESDDRYPIEDRLRDKLISVKAERGLSWRRISNGVYGISTHRIKHKTLVNFAHGHRIHLEDAVHLGRYLDILRGKNEEGTRPRNGNAYVTHAVQPGCRIKNFERPDQARERDEPRPEGRRDQAPVRST